MSLRQIPGDVLLQDQENPSKKNVQGGRKKRSEFRDELSTYTIKDIQWTIEWRKRSNMMAVMVGSQCDTGRPGSMEINDDFRR